MAIKKLRITEGKHDNGKNKWTNALENWHRIYPHIVILFEDRLQ
jgi:hypothetical protein